MPSLNVAKLRSARHLGAAITRPISIGDGAGLYLQVTASNTKSWLFRFTRHGKSREMGLGSADPDGRNGLSLANARLAAAEARKQLRAGNDPIAERDRQRDEQRQAEQQGREQTFRKAAEGCIEALRPGWKNKKHAKQWVSTLTKYAYPVIGDMDVAKIAVNDILAVLNPIWTGKPETASRVRQRVEKVLDYAAAPARRWRSAENPARWRGVLEYELPSKADIRSVRHHPSLSHHEVNAFVRVLDQHDGMAALALKFAILTACRSNECLGLTWADVNFDKATATIPGERMKAGVTHRIPLSEPVTDLLRTVKKKIYGWKGSLVFPSSQTGTRMTDMALSQLVRGMSWDGLSDGELPRWRDDENRAVVPHGFRTSFKDWSLSHGFEDYLSEIALAHKDKNKTRAAYARGDLIDVRRQMMEAWAKHCLAPKASVTNIKEARR